MERDRLIAEIAKETGIRLDSADPLLAAATTNRILLGEALAELQRAVRISGDQVSAACLEQIEAAKTAAAALITDAGVWSAERLRDAAAEASNAVIERLREETTRRSVPVKLPSAQLGPLRVSAASLSPQRQGSG